MRAILTSAAVTLLFFLFPGATFALSSDFTSTTIPTEADINTVYVGPTGTWWASGVASGSRYIYRSTTNGSTWQSTTVIPATVSSFWESGSTIYVGVSSTSEDLQGVWVSTDSGENFSKIVQTTFPTYALAEFDGEVYAGGEGFYKLTTTGQYVGTASLNTGGFPTTIMSMVPFNSQLVLATSSDSVQSEGVYRYNAGDNSKLISSGDFLSATANADVILAGRVLTNPSANGVMLGSFGNLGSSSLYAAGIPFASLTYGDKFVGAAQDGAGGQNDWGLWYSLDGTNWNRTSVTSFANSVFYRGGTYLAGVNGGVYISANGINWTARNGDPLPPPISTPSATPKRPLILIHGIGGFLTDWIDNGLLGFLSSFGYQEGESVLRFRYSDTDENYNYQGDIKEIGSRLAPEIESISSKYLSEGGDGKVDILGFSMGGVVGREGLVSSPSAAAKVRKFINVGVPNLGSYMAAIFIGATSTTTPDNLMSQAGNWLVSQIVNLFKGGERPLDANSSAVQQLRSGSTYLQELNSKPLPTQVRTYTLYGDEVVVLKQKLFFLDLAKEFSFGDFVVSSPSASNIPGSNPEQYAYTEKPQIDVRLLRTSFAAEYSFIGDPKIMKYFHNNLLSQPDIRQRIVEILESP